jgi:hypothetical protein
VALPVMPEPFCAWNHTVTGASACAMLATPNVAAAANAKESVRKRFIRKIFSSRSSEGKIVEDRTDEIIL